ncbi:DUF397 domain-containing protein [Streptomyces alkaliphilus]|uniref:DUF397 domain-containing protein n=1 Tax=Streptomyces alkaliphilus TaxID=1472722 RepID=A0A7W3Y182_9ACTN|nr:DUF397 domain-containing protein [Streptomyces alkaliphilus]MBB0244032.1 DUF397 domain-containing protein [Streptomyces alkaliphilus]
MNHHRTTTGPDVGWRKSTYSNGGEACVEVADIPDGLAVRDSKDITIPVLTLPAPAWNTFIATLTGRAV